MRSSIKKESTIIIVVIAVIVSIAVGYALFSQSIDIKGTATAEGEFDIIFSKVNKISEQGSKNASANIISEGKELSIEVPNLEYPTSYANINVTIKNNGTVAAKVTGIKINDLQTQDITVTYSGIDNNDVLNINEEKNIDIKVKWDEESVSTNVSASFTINITYEQVTDSSVTTPPEEEKEMFVWESPTVISGLTDYGIEQVKASNGHLAIPEGVTEIAGTSLEEVGETGILTTGFSPIAIGKINMNDSNQNIEDVMANSEINIIKSVSFPSTLKKIGDMAFYGCNNLTGELNLPEGLEEIGDYVFVSTGITGELLIPNSITTIESYTFSDTQITSLALGNNVKIIKSHAFSFCTNLTGELYIPDSVLTVERSAFTGTNITSVSIPSYTEYNDNRPDEWSFPDGTIINKR